MEATILSDQEIGGPALKRIKKNCVHNIVGLGKCAEFSLQLRSLEATHFLQELELFQLTKRNFPTLRVLITLNIVARRLVDQHIHFVL